MSRLRSRYRFWKAYVCLTSAGPGSLASAPNSVITSALPGYLSRIARR